VAQLPRQNSGVEYKAFHRFGRGVCPETPRRLSVQERPETPHVGISPVTARRQSSHHRRHSTHFRRRTSAATGAVNKEKAGRLTYLAARLLLFVAVRRPAISPAPRYRSVNVQSARLHDLRIKRVKKTANSIAPTRDSPITSIQESDEKC